MPAPGSAPAPAAQSPTDQPPTDQPPAGALSLSGDAAAALQRGVAPAALTRLRDPAALQGCLTELSGTATTTALALDYAAYDGAPALIVVLAGLSANRVDVFVVGPGCAPQQADLVVYRSVPR